MAGMNMNRRLPVGIQSFKEIRTEKLLYVDKTDLIWNLVNRGDKYNYLSRPRRFGKSVLIDTLQMYLEGRKELFEGLKIMELEKEWVKRPVIRLDMSQAGAESKSVRSYLDDAFHTYETEYGIVIRQELILKLIVIKSVSRWPFLLMNTTRHYSIPGRRCSMRLVPPFIGKYLPF